MVDPLTGGKPSALSAALNCAAGRAKPAESTPGP
jgi:hypothetical protein